jgi:hypothetical protein
VSRGMSQVDTVFRFCVRLDGNLNSYDQYYSSVFGILDIYLSFSFLSIFELIVNCMCYVVNTFLFFFCC